MSNEVIYLDGYKTEDATETYFCFLQANNALASMPASGADVRGLKDSAVFAPGSSLRVLETGELFYYGDNSIWYKWDTSGNANRATIVWKNGDTTLETDSNVPYGSTPSYDGETPTKEATAQYTYTFDEWDPTPVAVSGDATYSASFTETLRSYTITFKNGETTLQTGSVDYGVTPEYTGETPTKDPDAEYTYEFSGWSPTIASVTEDATYNAQFTATPISTETTDEPSTP